MKWPLSLVDACLALIILFTISQIISFGMDLYSVRKEERKKSQKGYRVGSKKRKRMKKRKTKR